jgi:hypothetical protein
MDVDDRMCRKTCSMRGYHVSSVRLKSLEKLCKYNEKKAKFIVLRVAADVAGMVPPQLLASCQRVGFIPS